MTDTKTDLPGIEDIIFFDLEVVSPTDVENSKEKYIIQFAAHRFDVKDEPFAFSCRAPLEWKQIGLNKAVKSGFTSFQGYAVRCGADWSTPEKAARLKTFAAWWPDFTTWLMRTNCRTIVLAAHNGSSWDFGILQKEMKRVESNPLEWPSGMRVFVMDTMRLFPKPSTKKPLPPSDAGDQKTDAGDQKTVADNNKPKRRWGADAVADPAVSMKLEYWYKRMFGQGFVNEHTAPADVLGLMRVVARSWVEHDDAQKLNRVDREALWTNWDDRSKRTEESCAALRLAVIQFVADAHNARLAKKKGPLLRNWDDVGKLVRSRIIITRRNLLLALALTCLVMYLLSIRFVRFVLVVALFIRILQCISWHRKPSASRQQSPSLMMTKRKTPWW